MKSQTKIDPHRSLFGAKELFAKSKTDYPHFVH